MEQIFYECVALGLDITIFGLCYSYYRKKAFNAKELEAAPFFEINSDLHKHLQKNGETIPYAVVCGVVKATSNYLQSQYLPNAKGVIRKKITKERKVLWSPIRCIWTTVDSDIQQYNNAVPFKLIGNGRWLKSSVEVLESTSAEDLTLTTVYDHFVSHEDTVGDMIAGWFRGERTTGFHEIEMMLTEGTLLTGVGELIAEDGNIKLRPPTNKNAYFLTTLSIDSLIRKIRDEERSLKIVSIILGCLGLFLMSSIFMKYYRNRKRKLEEVRQREILRENSKIRRLADPTRSSTPSDKVPCCIICLSRAIEVIILECGHACLCLECSQNIRDNCPVCRSPIERVVPAYLP